MSSVHDFEFDHMVENKTFSIKFLNSVSFFTPKRIRDPSTDTDNTDGLGGTYISHYQCSGACQGEEDCF